MKQLTEFIKERQLGKGWKEISKDGFHAQILAFDKPSKVYGIDGGKISKLWIEKSGEVVCNYDRGWDVEPDPVCKSFYDEIIKKYN